MNLLIDIGNTNVTIGTYRNKKYHLKLILPTENLKRNLIPQKFLQLIQNSSRIGVSSVAPDAEKTLKKSLPEDKTLYIKYEKYNTLLKIKYKTPDTLGADRVVNSFATSILYGFPAIIVDIGSAITIDLVDEEGAFIGGSIFGGPSTMSKALSTNTEKLFEVKLSTPDNFEIGDSSEKCLKIGIYFSTLFAIKGFTNKYKKMFSSSPKMILTGGGGDIFQKYLPEFKYDKLLTLKGISLAIEKWAK